MTILLHVLTFSTVVCTCKDWRILMIYIHLLVIERKDIETGTIVEFWELIK